MLKKSFYSMLFVSIAVMFLFTAGAREARANEGKLLLPAHGAEQKISEINFINGTRYKLVFSVDGKVACSIPPGEECFVKITPGWHNFRAHVEGYPKNAIAGRGNVPAFKRAVWEIGQKAE